MCSLPLRALHRVGLSYNRKTRRSSLHDAGKTGHRFCGLGQPWHELSRWILPVAGFLLVTMRRGGGSSPESVLLCVLNGMGKPLQEKGLFPCVSIRSLRHTTNMQHTLQKMCIAFHPSPLLPPQKKNKALTGVLADILCGTEAGH